MNKLQEATSSATDLQHAQLLFEKMVLCRTIDEKTLKLSKQNKGGTFHISTNGHEMIGAICGLNLQSGSDFGLPYYRDRGFAIGLGATASDLLAAFLAKNTKNHSGGRMMPEHFCQKELKLICQSSVVGSQFLQAVGVAKSIQLKGVKEAVYVSAGDGATSQGDFHEALNFATIHKLPVVFVIQDNEWAISVPPHEQTSGGSVAKMASGYTNLDIHEIDGTDFESCDAISKKAIAKAKEGFGPTLIVAKVPRLSPHSSSDDHHKYKSDEQIAKDKARDPIQRLEAYLIDNGVAKLQIDQTKQKIFNEVEEAAKKAEKLADPDTENLETKIYHPIVIEEKVSESNADEPIVMVDAINYGLKEAMQEEQNIVVFGQDVAHGKGGVFRATNELTQRYQERCFNTPLAESTIVGIATGMSMAYHKPVAEIQFADYLWTGINQLFNELATMYFRSNSVQNCPVVIRMPTGGYIQGGPYHSQNIEGFLAHQPGLKIVYPSNAEDAKRLLKAAIKDPNPVVILEHKALYRQRAFSARKEPNAQDILPLGKANLVKTGSRLTIVTWGMMTAMSFEIINRLKLDCDLIDLRTISPWDRELVFASVKKTGKLLVLQEAQKTAGFAAEIAATVSEELFEYLDAPIQRYCGLDIPVSYSKPLEDKTLPQIPELEKVILNLISY